jgi:hypothetical protein
MKYDRLSLVMALLIFLLVNVLYVPTIKSNNNPYWYDPRDVELKDNAYNITDYFSLQWWYFDAMFDNDYSIYVGMMTVGSKGIHGFFLFQIDVYKNGELIEKKFRFVPVRFVDASHSEPLIKVLGKEVLRGYVNDEDRMVLDISLDIRGLRADLKFTGITKGWIGFTGLGMWGCPLPKAHVTGNITVEDENIPVNGTGYQEHGWDVRRLHRSWHWGKFTSDSTNVVFSQNMKNRWEEDVFLVVVNAGEENYTSIFRENIKLYHEEYVFNHGRLIPVKSVFEVDQDDIQINVEFEVQSIDFKRLLIFNYWRLHAKVNGTISAGNITEDIDDFQIMDFFHHP